MGSLNTTGQAKDIGPVPGAAERRGLLKQAHALKAALAVGHQGLSDAFVEQVRLGLASGGLVKVRLGTQTAGASDEQAEELARRIPCHLLRRIGRVAILYRKPAG